MRKITKRMMKKAISYAVITVMAFTAIPQQMINKIDAAETTVIEVSDAVEINGYQISAEVQGLRTIYSVEPEIDGKEVVERGLVYGMKGLTDASEMYCGSEADYVLCSPAVIGLTSKQFSQSETAQSYIMTMQFVAFNVAEYNTTFMVRAYAKLSDGTYKYSDIKEYNIYHIALKLYNNTQMPDKESHNYLYDTILSLVNPDTVLVDYDWGSVVVKPW